MISQKVSKWVLFLADTRDTKLVFLTFREENFMLVVFYAHYDEDVEGTTTKHRVGVCTLGIHQITKFMVRICQRTQKIRRINSDDCQSISLGEKCRVVGTKMKFPFS